MTGRRSDVQLDAADHADGSPNFQRDLGRGLAEVLRAEGVTVPTDSTVDDVVLTYVNREWRRIAPRRRRTCWSRELVQRQLDPEIGEALNRIEAVSLRGESLTPYQSTRLVDPILGDALFNEWQIQHFHLDLPSGKPARPGFVRRTSDLLFAMVTPHAVLFVDVRPHDAFADKELFQIVHRNWPEVIAPWRCDEVSSASVHDHAWARKARVSILTVCDDGTVYAPLGGGTMLTKNPTASVVMGRVNAFWNHAQDLQEACLRAAPKLAAQRPDLTPEALRFRLEIVAHEERRGSLEHLEFVPCEGVLDTRITFTAPKSEVAA